MAASSTVYVLGNPSLAVGAPPVGLGGELAAVSGALPFTPEDLRIGSIEGVQTLWRLLFQTVGLARVLTVPFLMACERNGDGLQIHPARAFK